MIIHNLFPYDQLLCQSLQFRLLDFPTHCPMVLILWFLEVVTSLCVQCSVATK